MLHMKVNEDTVSDFVKLFIVHYTEIHFDAWVVYFKLTYSLYYNKLMRI